MLVDTMFDSKQIVVPKSRIPIFAIAILALVFAFGLFIVGYDQGHLFSIIQGTEAFDDIFLHELFHDMRHAAGFPCH